MRGRAFRRAAAVASVLLFSSLPLAMAAGAAPKPLDPDSCKREPGVAAPTSTWAQDRLQLARTSSITRGRYVKTGQPVPIAVIDSGLDRTHHPQLLRVDAASERNAEANSPRNAPSDCIGHGTQVTAVIAAQPDPSHPNFVGVAPEARIIPIKVTTDGKQVQPEDVARGINLAVDAKAKIANVSIALPVGVPALRNAVIRAKQAGMLIVAAAGNDAQSPNRFAKYPAAYATEFDNVIGVGAALPDNTVANFSDSGRYVGLVAPGGDVQTVGVAGGYLVQTGTSFAAPYVSGTAALVLAVNPTLSAGALRTRLFATADAPPATVPDSRWGYGTVDPYLAITTLRVDAPVAAPTSARPEPIAPGRSVAEPDRTLQNVAIAVALGLLGVAVAVTVAAAVWRSNRRATTLTG